MFRVIQAATCAVALMLAVPVEAQHAQGGADKHGAEAEKATYPSITADVDIEIEFDRKYDSDDGTKEFVDLFTETELRLALHLMPVLKIALHGQLKPIRKADPDEDRVCDDHSLFAEKLYVSYTGDWFSLLDGKFTPNFGRAWDGGEAPGSGIFGTEFAEEGYELAERIGIGGGVTLDAGEAGSHTFTASTFFLDTSALSNSVINKRGQNRRASGGVSKPAISPLTAWRWTARTWRSCRASSITPPSSARRKESMVPPTKPAPPSRRPTTASGARSQLRRSSNT